VKLLIVVFGITNNPCLPQGVISMLQYSESLCKMLQNEPCLHCGPWSITEIFWDKIIRFCGKITKYWKKMYYHFTSIFTSVLNSCESSYDKCHRLTFLAHLSWKLKWAFLITFSPSSVCPSDICLLDFYIFNFFSRTAGPILTKVGTNHP
jgi:hypothetical protein